MKFFIFLFGIVLGVVGHRYYLESEAAKTTTTPVEAAPSSTTTVTNHATPPPTTTASPTLAERARDSAAAAKDAVSNKLVDWHLTPAEIKEDLAKTGTVVRTKTAAAGRGLSNVRIVAVIKGKYALENELSARTINVDADAGKVTLHGTAGSAELIARAIALALETDGVNTVESQLTVTP